MSAVVLRSPPQGTYRLQLCREFDLHAARELVGYLHQLGVRDMYVSPLMMARAGSQHGYDVVDPTRLNPELGDAAALEALVQELSAHDMGLVLDIVPNHMSVGTRQNPFWNDVLLRGQASPYASWFDIDWERVAKEAALIVPLLAAPIEELVDEIRFEKEGDAIWATIGEVSVPLLPSTVPNNVSDKLAVLSAQPYRLVPWYEAGGSYRRYADINQLAALRVEDPTVLRATHTLVKKWADRGWITGLRIDHPDGLRDAQAFLRDLQEVVGGTVQQPFYVVVEKPMGPDERLPESFLAHGTTGYDFLSLVSDLAIDARNEAAVRDVYRDFTGRLDSFAAVRKRGKQEALDSLFGGELGERARQVAALAIDISEEQAARVLRALLINFPVGRLNVSVGATLGAEDRALVGRAHQDAARDVDDADQGALAFVVDTIAAPSKADDPATDFVLRFMQLCASVTAKGVEDTALYRDATFVALNEVGGDPSRFGSHRRAFHARNAEIAKTHPLSMCATSTHDTKRSEDVRARLAVLSEMPDAWRAAVEGWRAINNDKKPAADTPNGYEEYFLYQTLVGAWPLESMRDPPSAEFVARMQAYVRKAAREAKERTSWLAPDRTFEDAIAEFVARILQPGPFVADMQKFLVPVVHCGLMNSLSQIVLKIASPGIPDTYQGNELWDFSLVDPDNRRPVDFDVRRKLLAHLDHESKMGRTELVRRLRDAPTGGGIKLFVLSRALAARNRHPALFTGGRYRALSVEGPLSDHAVAFCRQHNGHSAVCVTGRFFASVETRWEHNYLTVPDGASGRYRDVFSGAELSVDERRRLSLARMFLHLPVALLESME